MDEVILSRIRQEAYQQGYQDGKVDGYNLAGIQMSSVKQERKKGKWYDVGSLSCRCSECGCKSQKESSFCPNCGAEMEEEDDDKR